MGDSMSVVLSVSASTAVFVYVIGAPGSGKGTLCKLLVDNHNVVHLSVGDILRDAAAQQAPDREIVEHVGAGTLVPAETLSAYVRRAMAIAERQDQDSMFLIDGAPRKMSQIKHLESTMGMPAFVLFFNCPETTARGRVLRRNVEGRNDTLDIFEKRYAEFASENPAIVEYYRRKGLLLEIDTSTDTQTSFASLTVKLTLKRTSPGANAQVWKWWMDNE